MAIFVRVTDNVVREKIIADALPPFTEEVTATFHDASAYPSIAEGWVMEGETFNAPLAESPDPLDYLEQLISQGQAAMVGDPLPLDIQKQIYDLEPFIRNYYKRKATTLIVEAINAFDIPLDRVDVTEGQRTLVAGLKTAMLGVFN